MWLTLSQLTSQLVNNAGRADESSQVFPPHFHSRPKSKFESRLIELSPTLAVSIIFQLNDNNKKSLTLNLEMITQEK